MSRALESTAGGVLLSLAALAALAATLADATGSADQICDQLVTGLPGSRHQDDDVALLVLIRNDDNA